MNKTIIIAKREYITRVRKKSFIIMTLVGPLSFSLLMIIPILLSTLKVEKKIIQVVDESHFLEKKILHFIIIYKIDGKMRRILQGMDDLKKQIVSCFGSLSQMLMHKLWNSNKLKVGRANMIC